MPHTKRAFDALENMIPEILRRTGGIESLLYVGWRHDCKPWWYDTFAQRLGVTEIAVLEIFPPNVSALEQKIWEGRYNISRVYEGDVRNLSTLLGKNEYDLIFWDHGPEHVDCGSLGAITWDLQVLTKKAVIYSCPWGDWPQGIEDGNEHEVHRNSIEPEHLEDMQMSVISTGTAGQVGEGELLGFYFKNGEG